MKKGIDHIASLIDIHKENIFKVPDSYFESLAGRLMQKPILGINEDLQKVPLDIPRDYFDTLHGKINGRIDELGGGLLLDGQENPFKVPDGYFESLEKQLGNKILPEKSEVFGSDDLPVDYFDTLSEKIHERIEGRPEAKVVLLYPEMVRYAVAASVVVFLSIALYFYQQKLRQEQSDLVEVQVPQPGMDLAKNMIASLSKSEVTQYLEQQEEMEHQELLEYTSTKKKDKIWAAFEKEILPLKIRKQERQDLELELDNIDISDLESDI